MTPVKSNCNRTARMTLGQLCQAISDGTLQATVENSEWYVVSGRELRRLDSKRQSPKPGAHLVG